MPGALWLVDYSKATLGSMTLIARPKATPGGTALRGSRARIRRAPHSANARQKCAHKDGIFVVLWMRPSHQKTCGELTS
jgi:hypothetical protein